MSQDFLTQNDVDEVAELLSRVSWDEQPTEMEPGIEDTDEEETDTGDAGE